MLVVLGSCNRPEKAQSTEAFPDAPVILISIDTLRADRLPAYGYSGVRTPHIDALRGESILYSNAYSHVPLTLPSHASILTGLLPEQHKVRNNIGYPYDPAMPSIPSMLKGKGYETGAAVSAVVLRGTSGLARAFDFYDDTVAVKGGAAAGSLQRSGRETVEVAKNWISPRREKPFFFMLHLFEPHSPYVPAEQFRSYPSPYDGEIATVDEVLGSFISFLKEQGIYDRAVIVLLSDHGEGLNDHGEDEHGIFLYREAIHVPLMVKLPQSRRGGETVQQPAQLIDVLPTVAELAGATPPATGGNSLLKIGALPVRSVFSETMYPRIHLGWSDLRSLVDDSHHYIDAPSPELYDVKGDPGEKNNVLADNRRVYARMRAETDKHDRTLNLPTQIDPEAAKQLTALGYLGQSGGGDPAGPLPDPKDRIGDLPAMRAAATAAAAGRYDEAIAALKRIVEGNPRFVDAWSELAKTLDAAGRHEEAIAAYKRNIELSPSLATELSLSIGFVYLNMRKFDDAEAHARAAISTNPPGAYLLLARAALGKKDFAATMQHANAAIAYASYRKDAMVLLGQALAGQHRFPEALDILQKAKQEAGATPVALLDYARGDVLARMNRISEAEAAFNEEIANFPRDHHAYASMTVLHLLQGREQQAVALMQQMIRANPSKASSELAVRTFTELERPDLAARFR
jgi:tetratricopeptide (TPR) repeat protein